MENSPRNSSNTTNISVPIDFSINYDSNKITVDSEEKIILSVYWKNGMLGAASYNNHLSEIQILHDVMENKLDFKMLNALFIQIKPTSIVVSNLQDGMFLKIIKQLAHDGKINVYTNPNTIDDYKSDEKVNILPNQYFKFKSCERLILSMPLAFAPKNEESYNRYIRGLVDFNQALVVCALGALLYFINTPLSKLNLPTNFTIMSLRILNMDDVVWLNFNTYEALGIFSAHEHPSAKKWSINTFKGGLSIFVLLNRCHSTLGSKYLKYILAQPNKNLNVLENRHEVIEFCLKECNKSVILSLISCIKQCHCVLSTSVKINNGTASMNQWKLLYQTAINAIKIGEICERYSEEVTFFRKIKELLKDSLYTMVNSMSCIIDFEQSIKQNQFIVKTGFTPELDEKKSIIKNMSQELDEITLQELKMLPSYIEQCSIRRIPEIGFLLCIPFWKHSNEITDNDYIIQNLEFKFRLTENVYYKTSKCYELDQIFSKIQSSIIQEEIQTMLKLSDLIIHHCISDLHEIIMLVAELDCLIAFADVAQDLKLIKPKILPKEHCVINIVNGRHILQEKYVDKFIPNSYNSSKINQPIKILTGFNSSGKSVYLKQVTLISYLCHTGCYVPAERVEISILDHIYTRIQSTESVSTLMSAFMLDLKQISVALNESTCRSLVILDEFGKGTSETNGLALLLASINDFAHRQLHLLPHVLISTHFHLLPNFLKQIVNEDVLHRNIKYLCMSHKIENFRVVYSYKVVDKTKNQNMSMAHNIAAMNGLLVSIVERATEVLQLIQQGECVNRMAENLRHKLFLRRKLFIIKILGLMQNEITDNIYNDLLEDLENLRYP